MKIETQILNDAVKLIRLTGRLDMKSVLLIDAQLTAAVADGNCHIIVDMAAVEFLASIGIRLLMTNAKEVSLRGKRMTLCQPQPAVLKVLQIAGIDTLIPTYPSMPDALASF